jgi:hypothetical protein
VNDSRVVEEAVANIPGMSPSKEDAADFETELDWESPPKHVALKLERNLFGSGEYFACYFSLLRDKFRENPDYKITIPMLEDGVQSWQESADEDWRHQVDDWTDQIPSAVAFLTGAFPGK